MSNRAIPHAIAPRLRRAATAHATQRFTVAAIHPATARAMHPAIAPAIPHATAPATLHLTTAAAAIRAAFGQSQRVVFSTGYLPSTITSVLRFRRLSWPSRLVLRVQRQQ